MSRAPAVLYDGGATAAWGGGGGDGDDASGIETAFAAFESLRALGIAIADPSFALRSLQPHLAPLTAVGILSALDKRAAEVGLLLVLMRADERASQPPQVPASHEKRRKTERLKSGAAVGSVVSDQSDDSTRM